MKRTWYRMFDPDPAKEGAIEIAPEMAQYWNDLNYGIFWSVNQFRGSRSKANLVRINSWYFEIDRGSKLSQWQRIRKFLTPSLVVESKRGFQVYFDAEDGTIENWDKIVQDRLIYYYQADRAVHDVSRILRVPGYDHCKDPSHRFRVREIFRSDRTYREKDLLSYFPEPPRKDIVGVSKKADIKRQPGHARGDLWDRVYAMDCKDALERLSGSDAVYGEVFTFKPVGGGKLNIKVNNKLTSCWIDRDGHIGSRSGGGPSIIDWLKWYGHPIRRVMEIMREYFPEIMDPDGTD